MKIMHKIYIESAYLELGVVCRLENESTLLPLFIFYKHILKLKKMGY